MAHCRDEKNRARIAATGDFHAGHQMVLDLHELEVDSMPVNGIDGIEGRVDDDLVVLGLGHHDHVETGCHLGGGHDAEGLDLGVDVAADLAASVPDDVLAHDQPVEDLERKVGFDMKDGVLADADLLRTRPNVNVLVASSSMGFECYCSFRDSAKIRVIKDSLQFGLCNIFRYINLELQDPFGQELLSGLLRDNLAKEIIFAVDDLIGVDVYSVKNHFRSGFPFQTGNGQTQARFCQGFFVKGYQFIEEHLSNATQSLDQEIILRLHTLSWPSKGIPGLKTIGWGPKKATPTFLLMILVSAKADCVSL